MLKVWLDDVRPAPQGWHWVKTVEDAKIALQLGDVSHMSLDNDLGEGQTEGRKLVDWMEEHDLWPSEYCWVHSSNAVAAQYMRKIVETKGPYRRD